MFKNPFSFNGRIRRLEFGISSLIYLANYIFLMVIADSQQGPATILALLLLIPSIWFLWAQGAKRCHDKGVSGWYQLIPFYSLILLFSEGYPGTNEYGDDPKSTNATRADDDRSGQVWDGAGKEDGGSSGAM